MSSCFLCGVAPGERHKWACKNWSERLTTHEPILWWRVEPVEPVSGGMQGFEMEVGQSEIHRQADKWARARGMRVRVRFLERSTTSTQ